MKITKVTYYDINKGENGSSFLSKCSVVLDDCMVLHDLKILNGKKGRYILMPSKKGDNLNKSPNVNNTRDDMFHPVDKRYFKYMSEIILKGYDYLISSGEHVYIP